MTKREIETIFNCDHKLIREIEYEVIPILHVDRLDHGGQRTRGPKSTVHFRAFDKDISLYLLENNNTLLGSNTPVYMARIDRRAESSDGTPKIIYYKRKFPMPKNLKLYHDWEKRAAITIYTDEENKAHMHGVIDNHLIVKPIPYRLHKEILPKYPELYKSSISYQRSNPSSNDPLSGDPLFGKLYESTHHIVIKPKVEVNSASYNLDGWGSKYLTPATATQAPYRWEPATRRPLHPSTNTYSTQFPSTPTQTPYYRHPATRRPLHPSTKRYPTRFPPKKVPVTKHPTHGSSKPTPSKPIAHLDIVYPELLVSVDYETYEFHERDIKELAKYMAAFWNAVDLRFRELIQPQVRLNIAGFIIPQTRDSAPYYNVASVDEETVLDSETLDGIQEFFAMQNQFPKEMYDIAVAMTRLDLGSYLPNGKLETTTAGIAYLGQACEVDSGGAAALVKDEGGFNGITTAAHELAHSMGAPHDGDESSDLPMGPCLWSDGYLMSYDTKDSKGMHWSECSIWAMREFFTSQNAQCLRTIPPNVGTPYPKILPGKLLSRDEQCMAVFGLDSVSSKEHENNCAILYCDLKERGNALRATEHSPPAEGSYCGKGAICLDAQCVKDPGVLSLD